MKKLTKQKIKNLEFAFDIGLPVVAFMRPTEDLRIYSWVRVRKIEQIRKLVLANVQIKVDL